MSTIVEKVSDAVNDVTAALSNTSVSDKDAGNNTTAANNAGEKPTNASQNEAVIASAAEGRRLYIGNLAYATTEGELTTFFKGYLV
jgi:RNA recognition motif-containing protein